MLPIIPIGAGPAGAPTADGGAATGAGGAAALGAGAGAGAGLDGAAGAICLKVNKEDIVNFTISF